VGKLLSQPKMGDYQTTRLLVSRALDRNGLAHNDSRDLDWFGPKMPYIQYGGGSLALLLEPRCSKFQRGANKPSSSENGSISFLRAGNPPFILQGETPGLHISKAFVRPVEGGFFALVSRRALPRRSGEVAFLPGPVWFRLAQVAQKF